MLTYYTHLNKCEPSPPCDAAKAPVNAWAAWEAGLSCHETVVQPWFAKVFGGFNLLGACCHLAGIVYTLTTARLNLTMQLSDVRIKVCNPNVDNLADVRHVFRLEPVLDEPEIALGWVVVAFFALSFCFHTVAAVALLGHQFVTPLRGNRAYRLYQYGLYENMAAWRYTPNSNTHPLGAMRCDASPFGFLAAASVHSTARASVRACAGGSSTASAPRSC
tara:strand:+ start:2890 stop:3546 length:657 start_codon:yes stop_codon:yes gene_type:complete